MHRLLLAVDALARTIVTVARFIIIVSGIALTVVMTANVVARYTLQGGGFSFAQELPMLIFPWFILAGIVLAAHMGAHMAVEWLYDKLDEGLRTAAFVLANGVSVTGFLILSYQAVLVAEIAGMERSPVLQLPNSVGYYSLAIGAFLVAVVTVGVTARVVRLGWHARVEGKLEEMPI